MSLRTFIHLNITEKLELKIIKKNYAIKTMNSLHISVPVFMLFAVFNSEANLKS